MLSKTDLLNSRFIAHAALLLAMIAWGASLPALKIASTAFSPFEIMAGRMIISSIISIPLASQVWNEFKKPKLRYILTITILCQPCLYFLFESFAMRYTSTGQAAMILSITPIFVAIGAYIFLKEYVPKRAWFGFLISLGGVACLSFSSVATSSAPNPMLGNTLELCAIICGMGYTVCVRYLTGYMSSLVFTAAMSIGGTIFFVPLAFLPLSFSPIPLDVEIATWLPIASIIFLGTVVTFGGYGLYNFGISRLSAREASAYTNLIPVITLAMGIFWLNELFVPIQYFAVTCIIIGVLLSLGAGEKKKS